MNKVVTIFGESERAHLLPACSRGFVNPSTPAIAWLAVRVWVGCMWVQAGWSKVFGAENPYFLHNNGAGVAGFAGHGAAAYSWWGSIMHSFVVPNASWIAVLVAFGELAIGLGLVVGFLTRTAAVCSLLLLFTYIMSGTASVCAFYALCALIVLATWRTSTWIGVDGVISGFRQRRRNAVPVEVAPVVATKTPELVSVG